MTIRPAEYNTFFPPGFQTTPGQITSTGIFSRLKGVQSLGNSVNQRARYGFEDATQTNLKVITPRLSCQATDFVKSVKLKGYVGNTVVTELQTWMRVYREVWYPSTDPAYQNYAKSNSIYVPNPMLPYISIGLSSNPLVGQGSIPDDDYAIYDGQYVLLWLRWDGGGEAGAKTPYGVLFDWYWAGQSDQNRDLIYLNQTPSKSGGKSKSRTNDFVSNGINSTYSDFGISGYYLANLSIAGQANARYFLQDDTANPKPISQTSRSVTINVPEVLKERVNFSGTQIGLEVDAPLETIQPVGARSGQYVSSVAGTSLPKYKFSNLVLKKDGFNYLIAVDEDTQFKIERHLTLSKLNTFDLTTTGGKKIIGSGQGQNYVEPNIKFGFTPNSGSVWEVNPIDDSTSLPVAYVDGQDIGNLPAPADNKWIPGYAPATSSGTDTAVARAKYWYVLPLQPRNFQGGGCIGQRTLHSSTTAASNFTSPGSSCYQGLHFGKFLKSSVNSIGFSNTQIGNYVAAINEKAKAEMSNNLISTKILGYYVHGSGASRVAPQVSEITFTLAGVKGFEGGSRQTFPTSSSSTVGILNDQEKLFDANSGDQPGTQSFTGPPKDWKKILSDATARLISGSTVEKLTPNQLSKFLSNRLSEGAPLSLLKEIVLESILSAKLAVLQAGGTNRKAALAALKNDPLYQALVVAVNTTKIPPRTPGSGGTTTGSTNSSNSQSETRTIRINVVRGLPGYRPDIRPTASVAGQPELVQTFSVLSDDQNVSESKPRRFVFPFVPREVNYSGIGAQWTEIPRSGNYPIVDWTGFNLLKISFNFDIVDDRYRGVQGYGLNFSCEDQIRILREMAQTPYPVTFLNMDKFMQNEVRWPLLSSGRGVEFVIAEFSVTAVQRTGGGTIRDGTDSNQISRASCSMTLQEIPIETVEIVQMPAIKPCKKNCSDDKITKEKLNNYLLFVSGKAGF